MPHTFEAKAIVPGREFNLSENEDAGIQQASKTYSVKAEDGHVLGSGGELKAFGKLSFNPRTASITESIFIANTSGVLFENRDMDSNYEIGGSRNLLLRAVASSQLDQFLEINVLAEEKFGRQEDGSLVGISVQVDGAGVGSKMTVEIDGATHEGHRFLSLTPEDATFEMSEELKMDDRISDHLKGYAHPSIQKGLSDLEVVDYISGQIDRHLGNVFINPENGQVKGIDNDLAFPARSRDEILKSDAQLNSKMVGSLPKMISNETAEKIMKVSPEALGKHLASLQRPDGKGGLKPQEIQGAVIRFQELQAAIKNPRNAGIELVNFDEKTFRKAIEQQQKSFKNYLDQAVRTRGAIPGRTLETASLTDFTDAPRSSYLGSIVLEETKKKLSIKQDPELNGYRPANTARAAQRDPVYAEYAAKMQVAQRMLKGNPGAIENPVLRDEAKVLKDQKAQLEIKLAEYDKRLDELDHHSAGAMLKSLRYGGPSGAHDAFADKKIAVQQQLSEIERRLDQIAVEAITDDFKAGLFEHSANAVAQRQEGAPVMGVDAPAIQQAAAVPVAMGAPAPVQQAAAVQQPQPAIPAPGVVDQPHLEHHESVRDLLRANGIVRNSHFVREDQALKAAEPASGKADLSKAPKKLSVGEAAHLDKHHAPAAGEHHLHH